MEQRDNQWSTQTFYGMVLSVFGALVAIGSCRERRLQVLDTVDSVAPAPSVGVPTGGNAAIGGTSNDGGRFWLNGSRGYGRNVATYRYVRHGATERGVVVLRQVTAVPDFVVWPSRKYSSVDLPSVVRGLAEIARLLATVVTSDALPRPKSVFVVRIRYVQCKVPLA